MRHDIVLEWGCEELPARYIDPLLKDAASKMSMVLEKEGVLYESLETMGTPRRLVLKLSGVATETLSQRNFRRGPPVAQALGKNGLPTAAAMGFARSCGAAFEALEEQEGYLVYSQERPPQSSRAIFENILTTFIEKLSLPKGMRWGADSFVFLRPVRWFLALWDDSVLNVSFWNIQSDRKTYGHRVHHPEVLSIVHAKEYVDALKRAHVLVDIQDRESEIKQQIVEVLKKLPASAAVLDDPELLREVTHLVEWPQVLCGRFDASFLALPDFVIRTSLRNHQKCWTVYGEGGALLPYFVMVANLESSDPSSVVSGNERVVHARLSDAMFFYHQDQKQKISDWIKKLEKIQFQEGLGSLSDKAARLERMASFWEQEAGISPETWKTLAWASKADLVSAMVSEFPELQGMMGGVYAQAQGEAPEICQAIFEHYRPLHAGDELPKTPLGAALALCDRLDLLFGMFTLKQKPTADKDPYGLRRAAIAVVRLLKEEFFSSISLSKFLDAVSKTFLEENAGDLIVQLESFIVDRWVHMESEQGMHHAAIQALVSLDLGFHERSARVEVLSSKMRDPQMIQLIQIYKRMAHLPEPDREVVFSSSLLSEPEEKHLWEVFQSVSKDYRRLLNEKDFDEALNHLIQFQEPLEQFFSALLVMHEQDTIRNLRLGLLHQIKLLFLECADFGKMYS